MELGKTLSNPRSSKQQRDDGHAKVDLEERRLRLLQREWKRLRDNENEGEREAAKEAKDFADAQSMPTLTAEARKEITDGAASLTQYPDTDDTNLKRERAEEALSKAQARLELRRAEKRDLDRAVEVATASSGAGSSEEKAAKEAYYEQAAVVKLLEDLVGRAQEARDAALAEVEAVRLGARLTDPQRADLDREMEKWSVAGRAADARARAKAERGLRNFEEGLKARAKVLELAAARSNATDQEKRRHLIAKAKY